MSLLLFCFIALPAQAATVSDEQTVTQADGTAGYAFRIAQYDKTKDGDILLVVTDAAGTRTVYRPIENPLDEAKWNGYWGIKLAAGTKIKKAEVVLVKPAPPPAPAPVAPTLAAIPGKWTLTDKTSGALTIKLEAEGDAAKGYTLTGKATVKDAGEFAVTGAWDPAKPDEPIRIEAANVFKQLLEGLLGQSYPADAFSLGEKITAVIRLPAEWIAQLKKGVKTQADLKAFATGQVAATIAVPFKLKIDPAKTAFDFAATVDPIGQTATMALAAGQTWKEPFDFLPVTFDKIDLATDFKFEKMNAKANGNIDFFGTIPAEIEMITLKGMKPDLKVTINPDVNVIVGALGKLDIPVDLKDIFLPVLKKIEFGSFNLSGIGDLGINGKLPSMKMDFKLNLPNFKYTFNIDMPEFDFRKPELFTAELGKVVLPVLRANLDIILADLAFEGLVGKWMLVDMSIDVGSIKVTAAGDPAAGYDLVTAITLKDVGTMNATGKWSPAAPLEPVTFKVDNIFKTAIEALLADAYPKDAFSLAAQIDVTVGLAKEWVDQLKKGGKGAKTLKTGKYTVDVAVPFTLKFDPTKDAFNMTAKIDAVKQTVSLGLDAGRTWKEPFDLLPVTFDKIDLASDFKFEKLNAKAKGNIEFFGQIPAELEMITLKGMKPDLKVSIKPDVNMLKVALAKLEIPDILKDIFPPLIGKFEFGAFELGNIGFDGKLPKLDMSFSLNLPNYKHTFNLNMPEFDFRKPELFTLELKELVLPELEAHLPEISMDIAFEFGTGRWPLVELNADPFTASLFAEGDPAVGFTLDGSIGVKGLGDFKVNGLWGKDDPSKVIFTVDNAAKSIFEATLGKAVPAGWFTMGDKITATATLDKKWQDQLKKGGKGAKKFTSGELTLLITLPFSLKVDPTKDAFKMIATIDAKQKTATLALEAGEKWKEPFDFLPVTFDKITGTSDFAFKSPSFNAAGEIDFFVKMPAAVAVTMKDAKTDIKVTVDPDIQMLKAALGKLDVTGELGKYFLPLLDRIQFGKFELGNLGNLGVKGNLPSLLMDFTLELPNYKHTFVIDMPQFDFRKPEMLKIKLQEIVLPELQAHLPDIAMGIALEFATGKWNLIDLNLDLVRVKIDAEGDPAKGFTLDGTFDVQDVGDLKVNGLWSNSNPLEIVFTVDNPARSVIDGTIGQAVPKEWLEIGKKLYVNLTLSPEWQEQLKHGAKRREGAADASTNFTIKVRIPFKLKMDPTKDALKMEATINAMDKTVGLALADGQVWDKPFDLLPVRFDKLAGATNSTYTPVTISADGEIDLGAKMPVSLKLDIRKDNQKIDLVVTPNSDLIRKALSMAPISPLIQPLVDAAAPGAVIHTIEIKGEYGKMSEKKNPDVRLVFTLSKDGWSKKYDILVKDGKVSNPDEFAKQAGGEIAKELMADAMGGALSALGIKFKWTLIDLDLGAIAAKIDAEGDPKDKYSLSGDFKIPVTGSFTMAGAWYPAKPFDPIVFKSRNIFKPIIEDMIGDKISKDQFELKDEMTVTLTLTSEVVSALQSGSGSSPFGAGSDAGGGSPAMGGAGGGSSSPFKLDVGFPMKLQIDPTQKAFDMTGRVYPLEQTATLELDKGVVWKDPYGIIPATFNELVVGTDPSFTTLTINAKGKTDFLGDMEFVIDALMRKGQDPTLKIQATPTGDMVAAILKKAKFPEGIPMPKFTLDKFNIAADFSQMQAGQFPSAQLKFTATTTTGITASVDIDLPSISFKEPDKFATTVAKELVKLAESLVKDLAAGTLDAAKKKLDDLTTDPGGTLEDAVSDGEEAAKGLGNAAEDFAKDPLAGTKKLLEGASDLALTIGESAFNGVTNALSEFANDPIGTAMKNAEKALETAKELFNSALDTLNEVGKAIANAAAKVGSWLGLCDDPDEVERREKKRKAEEAKAEAEAKQRAAEREIRELRRLADYEAELKRAGSPESCDAVIDNLKSAGGPDVNISINGTWLAFYAHSAAFVEKVKKTKSEIIFAAYRRYLWSMESNFVRRVNDEAIWVSSRSVKELDDFKSVVDADERISADQKSKLKTEIEGKKTPPVLSRQDALTALLRQLPYLNDDELALAKQHVSGTKIEKALMFPNVDNLTADDRKTVMDSIDKLIVKYGERLRPMQIEAAEKKIAGATVANQLKSLKEGLAAGATEEQKTRAMVRFLTTDDRNELLAKIAARLAVLKTEAPKLVMDKIRAYIAKQISAGAYVSNPYSLKSHLEKLKKYIQSQVYIEDRELFGSEFQDDELNALSADQKTQIGKEIDAKIGEVDKFEETACKAIEDWTPTATDLAPLNWVLNMLKSGNIGFNKREHTEWVRNKFPLISWLPEVSEHSGLASKTATAMEAVKARIAAIQTSITDAQKKLEDLVAKVKTKADAVAIQDALAGKPPAGYADLSVLTQNPKENEETEKQVEKVKNKIIDFEVADAKKAVADLKAKLKTQDDFLNARRAIAGNPPEGYPDLLAPKYLPTMDVVIADFSAEVDKKIAAYDAVSEKISSAPAMWVKSFLESINAGKQDKEYAGEQLALMTPEQIAPLKTIAEARLAKLAKMREQREALKATLATYTTADEINLFIEHLEGKTVLTLGSFSLLTQDMIDSLKSDARGRIAELKELQDKSMKELRDYLGRVDSEKGFDEFKNFIDNYKTYDRSGQPKSVRAIDVVILSADLRSTLKSEADELKGGLKKKQDDASAEYRAFVAGLTKWTQKYDPKPGLEWYIPEEQRNALWAEFDARISALAAPDYRSVMKTADKEYLFDIRKELNKESVNIAIRNAVPGIDYLIEADRLTLIKEVDELISSRILQKVRSAINNADSSAVLNKLRDHVSGKVSQTISKEYPDVSEFTADHKTTIAGEIDARLVLVTSAEREKAGNALFGSLMGKVESMNATQLAEFKNDINGFARTRGPLEGPAPDYSLLTVDQKEKVIQQIDGKVKMLQAAATPPSAPAATPGSLEDFKNRIKNAKSLSDLSQIQAYLASDGKAAANPALGLPSTSKLLPPDKPILMMEIQNRQNALQSGGTTASSGTSSGTTSTTTATTSYTPSATNVSKGKPASGSAACGTSEGPEKAVNGTANGGNSDKWCSTADQKYLEVDLGASYNITEFVVAHAGGGGEDAAYNTKDFEISVSSDNLTWTKSISVSGNTSNVTKHTVQSSGRYVRLSITTPTQGSDKASRIYEFEVIGTGTAGASTFSPSASTLSKGKTTSGSAACGTSEGPEKAVNGTANGGNSDKWCSTADPKYLEVDLGASYTITEFVVAHAGGGGEDASYNTKDFEISVSADKSTWTKSIGVSGNTSNVTKHSVKSSGRYVKLTITTPTQGSDKAARIYEFEVIGK